MILSDWARLLVPGGKLLFTDPMVVTGPLSHKEIAARSEREDALRELEGSDSFDDYQELLEMVELLARERRLSRFVFLAQKPAD